MNITKGNFRFVPFLDYRRSWTDKDLYARYQCTKDEIQLIESMMRPLEYILHTDNGEKRFSIYEDNGD